MPKQSDNLEKFKSPLPKKRQKTNIKLSQETEGQADKKPNLPDDESSYQAGNESSFDYTCKKTANRGCQGQGYSTDV